MDEAGVNTSGSPQVHNLGDISVCLKNSLGSHKLLSLDPLILRAKSKYFADRLSSPNSSSCIEIECSSVDYNYHVDLLTHLHLPADELVDCWTSVGSALGVLQVALSLQCVEVAKSCVDYLEAVPWEDKEEEEILSVVPKLGNLGMPILARLEPVDPTSVKAVFLAAVRYAMSLSVPCPPFGDEIRASAQEQIEFMLAEDEETALVTTDDQVLAEMKRGLFQMLSLFRKDLSLMLSEANLDLETSENNALHSVTGLDWLCNVLPKLNLMREFVCHWVEISDSILLVVQHQKFECNLWRFKFKLIELTSKVLDAVGYGSVILPAACRAQLLKTWLPYIQKMKPVLDSLGDAETGFTYRMDDELCQSIQGAMVSLIVTLPSNDQADILAGWMESQQLGFPDLTEAFEIWCYRTKSFKRRLVEGLDTVSNGSLSSDFSA